MTLAKDQYTLNSKFSVFLLEVLFEESSWKLTNVELAKACAKLARKAGIKSGPSKRTIVKLLASPEFRRELRERREDKIYRALPNMEEAMVREATEGNVQAYDRMSEKVKKRFEGSDSGLAAIPDDALNAMVRHFMKKGV